MSTLSESDSTSTSSSSTNENPFHNLVKFNLERGNGPARSIPDALKALRLGLTWTVDFQDVGDPFAKNHIASRVTFAEPYVDGRRTVYGPRSLHGTPNLKQFELQARGSVCLSTLVWNG